VKSSNLAAYVKAAENSPVAYVQMGHGAGSWANPAFRQLFTETFIPGASREQMAWFNDLQKETASPDNASRLHYSFGDMDVSGILGDVSVPTLVLHARNDAAVPFEQGKALAAGIPGARFVDLNSANHILLSEEPAFADFVREIRSFISAADPE